MKYVTVTKHQSLTEVRTITTEVELVEGSTKFNYSREIKTVITDLSDCTSVILPASHDVLYKVAERIYHRDVYEDQHLRARRAVLGAIGDIKSLITEQVSKILEDTMSFEGKRKVISHAYKLFREGAVTTNCVQAVVSQALIDLSKE